ncbi:putative MFS family arabinose efflux permease [Stenotrophomonas rhizophila]|uniref:Putative MFS family arabinose efflux permease n=1 Tax=Stenotrophomonas rhizophila TaxID=216778 RepID=A0A498CKH3_9GAMM|nr:putative MFS family arabinose efflux permease [Stenotrophomonas rhizophila]
MKRAVTGPYRELFAAPGTTGFALAGLLARLPLPMTGIGIITLLAQVRGSYALAGAVAATFVLTYALLSPQVSRLVDRHGQRRVVPMATGVSVIGLLMLLAASWWEAPAAVLFLGALLAGAMPSMSAMVRARWTAIYRGQPRLQTAYALETVFDEVTFIVGPPLSIGLAVSLFPQAGVLAATVLLPIGALALIAQRRTEPPIEAVVPNAAPAASVIRLPGVRWLAVLMVAMGVIVGTVDIVSVAFAAHVGQPAAASVVLCAYAAGSCLSGVLFGALKLQTPLPRLLLLGGIATALTTLPLLLVGSIAALAVTVFAAGVFFAPTMIVAMSLIEQQVPPGQLTEGMTWLLAALNVGVALGAAIAGYGVDAHGPRAGYLVALCAGGAVLLAAAFAHGVLRSREPRNPGIC